MKLEDQVCRLKHAKKLKKLGIRQDTGLFNYIKTESDGNRFFCCFLACKDDAKHEVYQAFTVADLGKMIPRFAFKDEFDAIIYFDKHISGYNEQEQYRSILEPEACADLPCKVFESKNEADARAELLIYLIENDYIDAENINIEMKEEE